MIINFSTCRNQDPWNNLRWAASDYLTSELETLISMVDKEAMEKREPRYIYKFIDFCFSLYIVGNSYLATFFLVKDEMF